MNLALRIAAWLYAEMDRCAVSAGKGSFGGQRDNAPSAGPARR